MTGETPDQISGSGAAQSGDLQDDPGAFTSHPRWQRMLIGLAGPAANFILAFGLMLIYFAGVNEVPNIKVATLEWVSPGSAAADAGLQPGDSFLQLGDTRNPDFEAVVNLTRNSEDKVLPVVVSRNGQSVQTTLRIPGKTSKSGFELSQTGMYLQYVDGPIGVDQTVPGSPAARAGLKGGDSIVAVDGHALHTVDPLLDYLQQGQGKPVTLTLERNGVTLPPTVVHPSEQDGQWRLGFMAVPPADPPMHQRPLSFSDSVSESREFCAANSLMIVDVLKKLLTHQASVKQLAGPVGIAHAAGQAAETKYWAPKFGLAAGISLNLGILNLLPFPILDGGLILLLLIESLMRHDISIVVKERLYQAAFVVLVMFFAYVSFNDVAKLTVFSHLKP